MRRLTLPPLLLLLIFALVACGGTKAPATDAPTDGNGLNTVFSIGTTGDPKPIDPAATPRPQPTAAPTGGLAVENLQYQKGENGDTTFTAQVINLGTEEARVAKVVLELYDATGQRLSRVSFSEPGLPLLKPGEGASWQGQRANLTGEWIEVRASVVAGQISASR